MSLPCKFRSWSDASIYRTVADSYTKTDVDGLIPDVSGLQSQAGLDGAVSSAGFLKSSGVLSAVAADGYLKSAGVLSAVAGDGYIKATNSAITEKAVASQTYLKNNADLIRLFQALRDSLDLKAPNGIDAFDFTGLIPV